MNLPGRWWGIVTRLWRLVALVCAAWLVHDSGTSLRQLAFSVEDARAFFSEAERVRPGKGGALVVEDSSGASVGLLVATSPEADAVVGYAGPSNLLVAFDNSMRVAGMRVVESADTPAHVDRLRGSEAFQNSLRGWSPSQDPPPRVEGVAGSTLTALAMVEAIVRRMGGRSGSLRFPEPLTLAEVREAFSDAAEFEADPVRGGWFRVRDAERRLLGFLARTSPESDGVFGYAGPTECLIAVEQDGRVLRSISIRKSFDTDEYVERVREDGGYLKSLVRFPVEQWPGLRFEAERIEGVAGATETSFAVAEAVRKKFSVPPASNEPTAGRGIRFEEWGMAFFLVGAVGLAFSGLRGRPWVRRTWQLVLMLGLGGWLGQLLSVGVLSGWARHGIPWAHSAPMVALAAVALCIPWGSGRQVYCHHLCPHGAAQEWLGKLPLPKIRFSPRVDLVLRAFPGLFLVAVFFAVLRVPGFTAANWEPFDFWGVGVAAVVPAAIALAGMAAACFVPMAHCRYGCLTGELLRFVRCDSSGMVWGRRDFVALICVGTALVLRLWPSPQTGGGSPVAEVRGVGFGTTWCVKARDSSGRLRALRPAMAAEIKRIEDGLSHWHPGSQTSRFNASRSLDPFLVTPELLHLLDFAGHLSRATQGSYDVTIAPLARLWGFGPGSATGGGPSEAEVAGVLSHTGWGKISVIPGEPALQKLQPEVELDLGSILQGYAVDRLSDILLGGGVREFLVEVGGELRASGAWKVAIEDPRSSAEALCILELKDAALATSGTGRSKQKTGPVRPNHILSPRTGRPIESEIEQISVRAPTCLEADGWATALLASGSAAAWELAARENLSVWMLKTDRRFEAGGARER